MSAAETAAGLTAAGFPAAAQPNRAFGDVVVMSPETAASVLRFVLAAAEMYEDQQTTTDDGTMDPDHYDYYPG